jgi:hypothetical protein
MVRQPTCGFIKVHLNNPIGKNPEPSPSPIFTISEEPVRWPHKRLATPGSGLLFNPKRRRFNDENQ